MTRNNVNTSLSRREELVKFLVMLARRWRLAGQALSSGSIGSQGVTAADATLATELAAAPYALDGNAARREPRRPGSAPPLRR
jgi:hypothetical protein